MATVDIKGLDDVIVDLTRAPFKVAKAVRTVTLTNGQKLLTKVKANASGRPGPRAPTGDYRRSIAMRVFARASSTAIAVGTNAPQGRRLEGGFVGPDSRGRVFNQPPYPHFGPAHDEVAPKWQREVEDAAGEALD